MAQMNGFGRLAQMLIAGVLLGLVGCAPSFQGIKMRAQAPMIDVALKNVTLALTVDGYTIEKLDLSEYALETGWREMKRNERSAAETALPAGNATSRITVKMAQRGSLYDVFVTPWIRTTEEGKEHLRDSTDQPPVPHEMGKSGLAIDRAGSARRRLIDACPPALLTVRPLQTFLQVPPQRAARQTQETYPTPPCVSCHHRR